MAPPVKEPGQPPDVTALIVTRETDVNNVLRGSGEKAAENAYTVTMETVAVLRYFLAVEKKTTLSEEHSMLSDSEIV